MKNHSIISQKQDQFLEYLISHHEHNDGSIPSIKRISEDLEISAASARERLELAKTIGLIDAQPRKGIEILPYSFYPAVVKSLYCGIKMDKTLFQQFSDFRNQLEKAYFIRAAGSLTDRDRKNLEELVSRAKHKLNSSPAQIPHNEHRNFHLLIYKHLDNIFVTGCLEAFWDVYELVGMNLYEDLEYLQRVWNFHEDISSHITQENLELAAKSLSEHMEMIYSR